MSANGRRSPSSASPSELRKTAQLKRGERRPTNYIAKSTWIKGWYRLQQDSNKIAQFEFLSEIPNSHPPNPIHEQLCPNPFMTLCHLILSFHAILLPYIFSANSPRVTLTKASCFSAFKEDNTSSRQEASTCRPVEGVHSDSQNWWVYFWRKNNRSWICCCSKTR